MPTSGFHDRRKIALAALLAVLTVIFPAALLASPFCCMRGGPGCRAGLPASCHKGNIERPASVAEDGAAPVFANGRIAATTASCCQQILSGDSQARAGLFELRAPARAPVILSTNLLFDADFRPILRPRSAPAEARSGPSSSPFLSRAPPLA